MRTAEVLPVSEPWSAATEKSTTSGIFWTLYETATRAEYCFSFFTNGCACVPRWEARVIIEFQTTFFRDVPAGANVVRPEPVRNESFAYPVFVDSRTNKGDTQAIP